MRYDIMTIMSKISFIMMLALVACQTERIEQTDEYTGERSEYQIDKKTGRRNGMYKIFSDRNALLEEGTYTDGKLNGERKIYNQNGSIQILENYKDGLFEGSYTSFYTDGQVSALGQYIANQAEGEWKRYYNNGQLMEKVIFVHNEENGPFVEYYKNGNLKAEGTYRDGDYEHGLLKLYNEMGILSKKMNCNMGRCSTIWRLDTIQ